MKTLLSPVELSNLLEQTPVVVIDTRDPESYAAGHIPGAVNVRDIFTYLATTDTEGLDALQDKFAELFGGAGISGEETVVLYEDSMNTGFGQSCRGYFLLKSLGYDKAAVLHGGLVAWKDEGLPVTTEVSTPTPATFPVASAPTTLIATEADMLDAISDPEIVILDVRDKDEWLGLSSSPYGIDFCPRKGRIPGAVWLEWYNLMDEGALPCSATRRLFLLRARRSGSPRIPRSTFTASRGHGPRIPSSPCRKRGSRISRFTLVPGMNGHATSTCPSMRVNWSQRNR